MKKVKLKDGRTGILVAKSSSMAIINLDGFEEERKKALAFQEKYGEPLNVVPWLIDVKPSEIESEIKGG